jgi:glutathione S-transferase
MAELILHHGLASTCSKKVRMCLFEKGLDWESRVLNLQKFEQHDPEYLKLNPKGVVPTLVHDGAPITESSRIIEYLDRTFPDPPLAPQNEDARGRMKKWIDWSDEVGYAAVYIPTWDKVSRPVARQLSEADLARVLARVPTEERRMRWRTVAREGFSEAEFADATNKMVATLEAMEADLEDGPWLAGAGYSLADIAIVPFVERIFDLRDDLRDVAPRPRAWFAAMQARPTFEAAFFFDGIDTRTSAVLEAQKAAGLI